MQATTMTLTNEEGNYSVSSFNTVMNIQELFDFCIEPLLLAAGYSPKTIDRFFNNEEECDGNSDSL